MTLSAMDPLQMRMCIKKFTLNLRRREPILSSEARDIPGSVFQLISLEAPLGGVLGLGDQIIIHFDGVSVYTC